MSMATLQNQKRLLSVSLAGKIRIKRGIARASRPILIPIVRIVVQRNIDEIKLLESQLVAQCIGGPA